MQHVVDDPHDRDPREDEDWFQRLPPEMQEQTRRAWRDRCARQQTRRRWRDPACFRAGWEGGGLLAATIALTSIWSASSLVGWLLTVGFAFAVGVAVGWIVELCGGGRFRASLAGAGGFLAVAAASGPPAGGLGLVLLFCGLWLAANLFAVWGVRREFRSALGPS